MGKDHRVIQPLVKGCNCPPDACRCMETIPEGMVADAVVALLAKQTQAAVS